MPCAHSSLNHLQLLWSHICLLYCLTVTITLKAKLHIQSDSVISVNLGKVCVEVCLESKLMSD